MCALVRFDYTISTCSNFAVLTKSSMQVHKVYATAPTGRAVPKKFMYKLCWGCQTEQHTKNGKLSIIPGLSKFVCAACIAAARERKSQALAKISLQ